VLVAEAISGRTLSSKASGSGTLCCHYIGSLVPGRLERLEELASFGEGTSVFVDVTFDQ
jgi:hypothetical protein